jgi:hypothetical protein
MMSIQKQLETEAIHGGSEEWERLGYYYWSIGRYQEGIYCLRRAGKNFSITSYMNNNQGEN